MAAVGEISVGVLTAGLSFGDSRDCKIHCPWAGGVIFAIHTWYVLEIMYGRLYHVVKYGHLDLTGMSMRPKNEIF